ncbi:uncharacterized protein RCO7_08189 [Rhynchosporium graminicola]|uniref:Uncharacterized protein n=1 Tax=Rhynchosporium graminicola TaxID=2792576 RepID=A0A1E1LDI8_9HELO|nr:uncharacterized protein RCO7_08189 [Rhynchosporium commune]
MASPMGPPQPAGYSLRVQLFGPTAYDAADKPIRCFRVVASPDYTVEEFCEEASRIHQINYGEPLTLKKVQDDQQFDITQSEIIGSLFATASTVRFIQAATISGREDSVAPNSALRFDPSVSRKREREGHSRVNGSVSVNAWKPNKRQRVADPDEPLPSRENEDDAGQISRMNGRTSDANVIPNSQESIILGETNGHHQKSGDVRTASSFSSRVAEEIAETPPPSPPPYAFLCSPFDEYGSADDMNQHDLEKDSNLPSLRGLSSPLEEATARAQSQGSGSRAKSYHIQRATERGTSVSTAATSPLLLDHQPVPSGITSASQRRRPNSRPANRERNGTLAQSHDETSIYEDIAPDDEEFGLAALARQRKVSQSARNSPSGLLGLEQARSKLNTPPSGSRRSTTREQNTPGELPLTPSSKVREERRKEKVQADEARKIRLAAAEARHAEETLQAEAERAKREEQERIDIENFQHGEAERKSAVARAAQAEKEREANEKQEAEEERHREHVRVTKEQADEERRVAQEKADADEAERVRKEEQAAAALNQRKKTPTPEASQHSSPILPKARGGTPGSSTTPFIPGQRKSALKRTASSQAMRSSSPAGSRVSTDDSMNGSGVDIQIPLTNIPGRRVSFRDEPEQKLTPIRPPTRILPPKFSTPKSSKKAATPSSSTPKPSTTAPKSAIAPSSAPRSSPILPPPRSYTPILPPGRSAARSSLGHSITPVQSNTSLAPKEPTPDTLKKASPIPAPAARKSITPDPRKSVTPIPAPKDKTKSVESDPKETSENEASKDDSDKENHVQSVPEKQPELTTKSAMEIDSSEDGEEMKPKANMEIDEDETQSHNSSLRDSRSPVIFSQHPELTDTVKARHSAPPESDSNSESEVDDDDDDDRHEDDSNIEQGSKSTPRNEFLDDEADEGSSYSGSDGEEAENEKDENDNSDNEEDDEEDEFEVPNSSPPVLPPHKNQASPKPAGTNSSKDSLSDEGHNTQDEIDQQLTSSVYEAYSDIPESSALVYPPTSSAAPRPSMKIGVSLSSLSKTRSMLAASSAMKPVVSRSGQRALQTMDEESEESEEESDGNSSDSSGPESTKPTQKKSNTPLRQTVSSGSDSSSDSDSDAEDEQKKIRDELALEIASLNATDNSNSQNPKLNRTSSQQQSSGKERKKTGEKKSDKFLTGYKFNTSF